MRTVGHRRRVAPRVVRIARLGQTPTQMLQTRRSPGSAPPRPGRPQPCTWPWSPQTLPHAAGVAHRHAPLAVRRRRAVRQVVGGRCGPSGSNRTDDGGRRRFRRGGAHYRGRAVAATSPARTPRQRRLQRLRSDQVTALRHAGCSSSKRPNAACCSPPAAGVERQLVLGPSTPPAPCGTRVALPRYSMQCRPPGKVPGFGSQAHRQGELLDRHPSSSMACTLPVGGHLVDGAAVDDRDLRPQAARVRRSPWRCPAPTTATLRPMARGRPSRTERRKLMPSSTLGLLARMPRRLATCAPPPPGWDRSPRPQAGEVMSFPASLPYSINTPEHLGRPGRHRCAPGKRYVGWPRHHAPA